MSIWLLAVLWAGGASAAVVEAPAFARVPAAIAPIAVVPVATSLAPALSLGAVPPQLTASRPTTLEQPALTRSLTTPYIGLSDRQGDIPATPEAWSRMSDDEAAALGRRLFDRSVAAGLSPEDVFDDHLVDLRPRPFAGGHVTLRPITKGVPAVAVLPRLSPTAGPRSFERISIVVGDDLKIKFNAALAAATDAVGWSQPPRDGVSVLAPSRVPLTSTEWLERAGLLEEMSYADYVAHSGASSVPARSLRASRDYPRPKPESSDPRFLFAWWLSVLPAAFLFRQVI